MTHYLHAIPGWRASSGEHRNGHGPDEPSRGYRWRDPRRVSPERLAELEKRPADDRVSWGGKKANPRVTLEHALRTALRDPIVALAMREDSPS